MIKHLGLSSSKSDLRGIAFRVGRNFPLSGVDFQQSEGGREEGQPEFDPLFAAEAAASPVAIVVAATDTRNMPLHRPFINGLAWAAYVVQSGASYLLQDFVMFFHVSCEGSR